MISASVDVRRVSATVRNLRSFLQDNQDMMQAIGQDVAENVQLCFTDGRSPWGEQWEALKHRQGQPLIDTGRLRASIGITRIAHSSVSVGTRTRYSPTHQFGARQGAYGRTRRNSPIPWGDVPARPFLPIRNGQADLPPEWKNQVADTIGEFISRAFRQ